MPLIKKLNIEDGLLLLWEITENYEELLQLIPDAIQNNHFCEIRNQKRKIEWLASRILLQQVDCSIDQIQYRSNGQPIINNNEYSFISISHSDKLAGILLHKKLNIGLDIENLSRNFSKVEKKYLSEHEIVLAQSIPNGLGLFWCIKEALYKTIGIEGVHFANEIQVEIDNEKNFIASYIPKRNFTFQVNFFEINNQMIVYLIDKKGMVFE